MKFKFCLLAIFCNYTFFANAQEMKDLKDILFQNENLARILKNTEQYQTQILLTKITRNWIGKPSFESYQFGIDKDQYFYPASTVKLPACLIALEKLNGLKMEGITKNTTMFSKASSPFLSAVKKDTTSKNQLPSIEHYIKKILLVSDNDAFNRLYEFIGQDYFQIALASHGMPNSKIIHRLEAGISYIQNKTTNEIQFLDKQNKIIHTQPQITSTANYLPNKMILKGKGYINANDELVNEPFDFTKKNVFTLADQHYLLKTIFFPKEINKNERWKLPKGDLKLVKKYMNLSPMVSDFPKYTKPEYYDNYCKFILAGADSTFTIPKTTHIYNKVGDAYGFLLDNAYVVDKNKKVEFMVSVVVHCNANGIYNDGKYEYETIGLPFMKQLGNTFFDYCSNKK